MIDVLATIAFFVFLASLISLVVGLIVPSAFAGLFRKNLGRKKTGLIFSGITIMLLITFSTLVANSPTISSQKGNIETAASKTTPTVQQALVPSTAQARKPTTVSTEDCSQTSDPQLCIKMQINSEPRLNATVTFSNQGLLIRNNDSTDWTSCEIAIGADNNVATSYSVSGFNGRLPTHQITVVPWGNITQDNGNRFDYATTQPTDLTIDCSVNNQQEHLRAN